jgi:primary-amine oxidase
VSELSVESTAPRPLSDDALQRERIPPPRKAFDFLPDLMAKTMDNFRPREDVKPLHVIQPEGVSFKMNGHELEWQKWKMHIGTFLFSCRFSARSGLAANEF